jgi:hypothetical protein
MLHALCRGRPEWEADHLDDLDQAAEACLHCPSLNPCRDYAAQHRWAGITIAGWVAPRSERKPPPWA